MSHLFISDEPPQGEQTGDEPVVGISLEVTADHDIHGVEVDSFFNIFLDSSSVLAVVTTVTFMPI